MSFCFLSQKSRSKTDQSPGIRYKLFVSKNGTFPLKLPRLPFYEFLRGGCGSGSQTLSKTEIQFKNCNNCCQWRSITFSVHGRERIFLQRHAMAYKSSLRCRLVLLSSAACRRNGEKQRNCQIPRSWVVILL